MAAQLLTHTFDPVFDSHSRILVLGTFPSVKSRENHFYYGHPQNRFWRLMAELTAEPLPADISAKRSFSSNMASPSGTSWLPVKLLVRATAAFVALSPIILT